MGEINLKKNKLFPRATRCSIQSFTGLEPMTSEVRGRRSDDRATSTISFPGACDHEIDTSINKRTLNISPRVSA